MTLTTKDVTTWVQQSSIGDELPYRLGGRERNEDLFAHMRKLSDGGLVFLFQRRSPSGHGFDHIARRTKPQSHATLDDVSLATDRRGRFIPQPGRPNAFRAEIQED